MICVRTHVRTVHTHVRTHTNDILMHNTHVRTHSVRMHAYSRANAQYLHTFLTKFEGEKYMVLSLVASTFLHIKINVHKISGDVDLAIVKIT